MIVKLAGYNVEADILKNIDSSVHEELTPETFSAAYARISRSAKDITTLRKQARRDVKKARESNRKIIFKMGHHSVAEHAVFNWDIIGVSRLALEEIEQFRLVSYTEKSQRYVTLQGDYLIPEEIKNAGHEQLFRETAELQNAFYEKSFGILKKYIFDKYPQFTEKRSDRHMLEGWAKEDARYILSLATEGQVGMTINARNLEHLFRRFHLSQRAEVCELGKQMYDQVEKIAPSIFLFAQPSQFSRDLVKSFKENFARLKPVNPIRNPAVKLIRYSEKGDDIILASFLSVSNSIHYLDALELIKSLDNTKKEKIFKDLFKHMEFFDSPPREFEMADIVFEAVISASNFAQLKRHRLATLLPGRYDITFGNIVPENIKINGLEKEFKNIIDKTNEVYLKLKENCNDAADYILTNSHCRYVLMRMNLRELFHFIRLRSDRHTQWDIRRLSDHILNQVKTAMPLSTLLLCGKSDFITLFESIYHRKPEFDI